MLPAYYLLFNKPKTTHFNVFAVDHVERDGVEDERVEDLAQDLAVFDPLVKASYEIKRSLHTLCLNTHKCARCGVHNVTFEHLTVAPIITARGRALPIEDSMGWTPTNTPFSDQLATWDQASQRVAGSLPCTPLSWTPKNAPFSD